MSAWQEVKLTEITSKIGDGLHGTPKYDEAGGYCFVNGNNLYQGKIIIKADTKKVNEEEFNKYQKPLAGNTILLGINGTIGNLAYYNGEKCVLGKSACYINVNESVDKYFLYYNFLSKDFQNFLEGIATGTTIPNVPLKGLREYSILLPPLPEQKAIAGVLSSLDEKIDLLHRQNKTLEGMAEALWRKMFIEDTDPNWEKGKLGNEMNITMGQSPPGHTYNEDKEGVMFFQGRAEFGFRFPLARLYCTAPKRFAKKGDTLVSVRAPVGDINMAYEDCCIGRGLAAVRHKKDCASYTFYKIRSLKDDFDSFEQQGTVFGSIGKDDFNGIDVLLPSEESIQKFECTAKPIDEKILTNTTQLRTLSRLRDTLLPKLMSGEVKVKYAQ
jgi:type I restriction enzyme S subunit